MAKPMIAETTFDTMIFTLDFLSFTPLSFLSTKDAMIIPNNNKSITAMMFPGI